MAEERAQHCFAVILAAAAVDRSRFMEPGEIWTLATGEQCRRGVLDRLTPRRHRRVVKLIGDGAVVEFASAVNAVPSDIVLDGELCGFGSSRGVSCRSINHRWRGLKLM
jgi:hypothetical protein